MKKLIYFDNAATSNFKPKCVTRAVAKALKTSANPGRSGHKLSIKNAISVFETREIIANHFNCPDPNCVIFTKNCTEALNLAILGLLNKDFSSQNIYSNTPKKHVICSCFEHNSVLRALTHLKNNNLITLSIIEPENKKSITISDIKKVLTPSTYLVCLTHISNVLGVENDIKTIGKYCYEKGILFLVDCAQSAGHRKINMTASHINFLAFAGHKGFLAPQGVGGLLINSKILPTPINFGGTGTESTNLNQPNSPPECFESGTIMTPSILALGAGIKYVEKHFNTLNKKVESLTKYLINCLTTLENNQIVKIYSDISVNSGVVSFNINNIDSVEASNVLDSKFNIAVRGGLHCAPLTHKFLGTTNEGMIRVSLNFKNTKREIKKLIKAIKYIHSSMK